MVWVLFAIIVVGVVALSGVGVVGGTSTGEAEHGASVWVSPEVIESTSGPENGTGVQTDSVGSDVGGSAELVLRLGDADRNTVTTATEPTAVLQQHAEQTQQPVVDSLSAIDGVTVEQQFWVTNAVLISVEEVDEPTVDRLAAIEGVERVHRNFEVPAPEPVGGSAERTSDSQDSADADNRSEKQTATTSGKQRTDTGADRLEQRREAILDEDGVTYGLDQINVPEARETFDATGDGVRVAVLDTGVDPEHPDIDLSGYAAFDDDGETLPDEEPRDKNGHGTHVSGTVTGGAASGTAIGVAPDAALYHGRVLGETGGTFAQITAGIEWAVTQDADVLVMSLGTPGYEDAMLDAVQTARANDIVVVAAAGNDGEGTSGSPGNYPESVAVGATNEFEDIAFFSGGEQIDTDDAWADAGGELPNEDWPETYVVPDVSAPGFGVLSALPGGEYGLLDGTSMAAPHVAGVAALAQEADEEAARETIETAIERTTRKPGGDSDRKDSRYGYGIVDARSTIEFVTTNSAVTGTVETTNGDPAPGVEVALVDRYATTTDENGSYELVAQSGDTMVRIDEFGFESIEQTVTVPDGGEVPANFTIEPAVDTAVVSSPPTDVIAGETPINATFDVVNADEIEVRNDGPDDGAVSLFIDGQEQSFGDPVQISDGKVNVSVTTTAATSGTIDLTYEIRGVGDPVIETATTFVEDDPIAVAVVGNRSDTDLPAGVASAIGSELPRGYFAEPLDHEQAVDTLESYDAAVLNSLPDDDDQTESLLAVTEQRGYPAVYLELDGENANAATRVSELTGNPAVVEYGTSFDGGEHGLQPDDDNHPIFEDVPDQPDGVSIHTNDGNDHAYVEDASGESIATVALGIRPQGDAMVVDPDTGTAIAGGFGRAGGVFPEADEYTETGDRILANTVQYLFERDLGSVTGTVTAPDGQPIPNAAVTLTGENQTRTTTTDNDGQYQLVTNETVGDMTATAFRFDTDTEPNVAVVPGETATADFEITPQRGAVAGTVTDKNGHPIENATVEVLESGFVREELQTSADGTYEVTLGPGVYELRISADGFKPVAFDAVTVEAEETAVRDAELAPDLPLAVDVIDNAPATVDAGETVSTTFSVTGVDNVTITQSGDYDETPGLLVYDVPWEFGEPIDLSDGAVEVLALTDPATRGTLTLNYEFRNSTETTTRTTETVVEATPEEPAFYANDEGIVTLDGVREAIGDWQADVIDTELLVAVIDAWASGEPVESTTVLRVG